MALHPRIAGVRKVLHLVLLLALTHKISWRLMSYFHLQSPRFPTTNCVIQIRLFVTKCVTSRAPMDRAILPVSQCRIPPSWTATVCLAFDDAPGFRVCSSTDGVQRMNFIDAFTVIGPIVGPCGNPDLKKLCLSDFSESGTRRHVDLSSSSEMKRSDRRRASCSDGQSVDRL